MIAPQELEIGEKLLWKYDETSLKRRCYEKDYAQKTGDRNQEFHLSSCDWLSS